MENGTVGERMVVAPYLSRHSKVRRKGVEKVRTTENADELFLYLINDPDPERPWHYGVFIVHMEGMREQLRGREFEHKDLVFNNHSDKVPSFKELLRVALIILIRCCTRVVL